MGLSEFKHEFLEKIFIWPFELIHLGGFLLPFEFEFEIWLDFFDECKVTLILAHYLTEGSEKNSLSGKHEHHVGTLIARRLATNNTKGASLVASMPHLFCSLSKESRAQMMLSFLLLVLIWLP